MCGISGFNWKDEGKIKAMTESLSYRGPDAEGFFLDEGISLGHNRLSIIDLSVIANQPMVDNLGELVVVFNGEIYNFQEIRKELENEYNFKTKGDTEVILAGYQKWGKTLVSRLNGMFAFAIWDKRDNSLFCARDHLGMKPFYYFWDGESFIFASEIKGLFVHDFPRKLNLEAFNHYFRVLYTPEPMTMIKNIYKLPSFHTLFLKDKKITIESYDNEETKLIDVSYSDATKLLKNKVLDSVRRHLISDVPIGVYLSGGIDSSLILASTLNFCKNIETFSVGFDLKNKELENKFNCDLELAKRTAKFFGVKHNQIIVSVQDVISSFSEMMLHNSDPISNPTAIAMMLLSRFAKDKATVVLTGNAGDELFGGYNRYRIALWADFYKKLPRFLRSIGNKYPKISQLDNSSSVDLFSQFMFEKDFRLIPVLSSLAFLPNSTIKKYFYDKFFSGQIRDSARLFMEADQRGWLPDHFFMLSDKMSMSNALEERMPLADKELLYFSRSIPRSYKVDLFRTKKILKDAFRDDLPGFLFDQPKRGWFSPAAKWFRDPDFSKFAKEIFSSDYYKGSRDLFDWPNVQEMFEKHVDKREYNLTILWAILTFQVWAKQNKIEL